MALMASAIFFCATVTCGRARVPTESTTPTPSEPKVEVRTVRVLIASDCERLRIRANTASVRSCSGSSIKSLSSEDWFVVEVNAPNSILVNEQPAEEDCVELAPTERSTISIAQPFRGDWGPSYDYPGRIRINRTQDGRLNAINEVEVEDYVASVVANEAAPTFVDEALRGQAIISRTYVLFLMQRRSSQAFDVSATQGSQVYKGSRTDEFSLRAEAATTYTRGIVCTYVKNGREELFPTYYSSVCGGLSQSAEIFDGTDTAAPLRGGVKCDYCKVGPDSSYRWGPLRLPAREVIERVAQRYPAVWSLEELKSIDVTERSASGRPTRLKLVGTSGEDLELPAENFRLAIGASVIKSTDCQVRVIGGEVVWDKGRGYGHGLGLCQWGMQGQALKGKSASEILKFYYPGCELTRAY